MNYSKNDSKVKQAHIIWELLWAIRPNIPGLTESMVEYRGTKTLHSGLIVFFVEVSFHGSVLRTKTLFRRNFHYLW